MLEYWAVMYDNKIHSGEGYNVLKPSFSILIANYRLEELKEIEKYHTRWNLRESDFPDKIISKNIEMHVLEIPKIKDFEIFKDELAQYMHSYKIQLTQEALAEGRAEGEVTGAKKKQKEIAKKTKNKNIPLDEIIELTGLRKDEIKKL